MEGIFILGWLLAFLAFVFIQALFVNGVRSLMEEGMILNNFYNFVKQKLGEFWSKPFVSCVRCMAPWYGGILYWPTVTILFGFHIIEIPVFIVDAMAAMVVSWYIFKKN